ncbi:isocitrate dehydrogenase [Striga asiatica]|uniref:Isocitrate dehydrogenase n=1 Tax=Striga asiatica TaxID=4170 RepID=A0A5A7REC4_STRAF|nr:isocitrate dehydrogenase [Striga asiatica]
MKSSVALWWVWRGKLAPGPRSRRVTVMPRVFLPGTRVVLSVVTASFNGLSTLPGWLRTSEKKSLLVVSRGSLQGNGRLSYSFAPLLKSATQMSCVGMGSKATPRPSIIFMMANTKKIMYGVISDVMIKRGQNFREGWGNFISEFLH